MSENESFTINDLMKKVIIISKNIKTLTELIKNIDEKINQSKSNNEDDNEKMDKIFQKKGLGRPSGDHETKRHSYFEMVSNGRIKNPKEQTLEYYKIAKDGDEYKLMD